VSFGRAFVIAVALGCASGCTSDPEEAPPATDDEHQGEHHPLTATYRLVRLDYNPLQSNDSTLIVEPRAGGEQTSARIGESLDGYEIVKMVMQIDGISAVVSVKDGEGVVEVPINP
jgi:hypothetical protein